MNVVLSSPKTTQFRQYAEELSALIEQHGYAVRPYNNPVLPHFYGLSEEDQDSAIHRIAEYLEVCRSIYGRSGLTDTEIVQKVFEFYGYEYNDQILDMIKTPGHILEIYLPNHIQVFRSFDFYQLTSYTIEDVYCRRWMDLYLRDERITAKIFESAEKVFHGIEALQFLAEKHLLKERATLERLDVLVHSMFLTPLHKDGQIAALASVVRAEPV